MSNTLEIKTFRDVPLDDSFFDSLKQDYIEFPIWFKSKLSETAYVQYSDGRLTGFMYLKLEEGEVTDVMPVLPSNRRIKIGTLKVDAHGTKLGERLIKKAIDFAIVKRAQEIYVTIFPRHKPLIALLEEFGFHTKGEKRTKNGTESVLTKSLEQANVTGDLRKDYPLIDIRKKKCYLLAIKPEWHTKLFPDSIFHTENYDLVADVSHTNSISKTYICSMSDVMMLTVGDALLIYRTGDGQGPAEYRAAVSSVCVVEEIRPKDSFSTMNDYIAYSKPFSVFSETELKKWWSRESLFVIKMLYSAAFTKRIIRKTLIEDVGLDRGAYWGFFSLHREQFLNILNRGGIDGRLVIH